jgi:tetratricopeptide (TPR) repeat protein
MLRSVIVLAIALAYANSFHNGFHFDDFHTVVDNPAVRSLRNVPRFFTDATTFSVLPANRTYRPMVSTSIALDYALGHGYTPFWFHVTTFFLFLLLVLLLEAFYRLLLDRIQPSPENLWPACVTAAWFGLHPVMAETVNYVIQRGDLYCTLGSVAGLVVFARYRRLRRMGLYLLPLAFALLSKPPAAVFPVLLFFYVFFFEPSAKRVRASMIAAMPSAVAAGLLLWLQSSMTPATFMPALVSPLDYRLTQPFVWLRYWGEFFLPVHLNVDSDLAPIHGIDARVLSGAAFVVLLCLAIVYTARRKRMYPIAYGLIWFAVTQLPTSLYALSEVENDHRMFFSFVGLILAIVWSGWLLMRYFVAENRRRELRPLAVTLTVLLLAAYGFGVHLRNQVWFDEETLWRDDVAKSPHNGRGLMIYGVTQMEKGAYSVALNCFTRALAYTPNYATLEINLGVVEGALADEVSVGSRDYVDGTARAEAHFHRAIALAPEDDQAHAYYGRWLNDHGRISEAVAQLQTAVALNPQRPMQRDELIAAYASGGDVSDALQAAHDTLALMPDDALAQQTLAHPPARTAAFWINLSLAQYQRAEYRESASSAQQALLLDPRSAEAYNNLGAADAQLALWDAAIAADRKAIELKPTFQLAQNNLAWALAQKKLDRRR